MEFLQDFLDAPFRRALSAADLLGKFRTDHVMQQRRGPCGNPNSGHGEPEERTLRIRYPVELISNTFMQPLGQLVRAMTYVGDFC